MQAISRLIGALPADVPATVLITLHRPVDRVSHLPDILQAATPLRARIACNADQLEHGTCYIAPADRHLTICRGPSIHLQLDGFYRAHSIDALLNSVATSVGHRAIGVVLSGLLKDGTLGLQSIKNAGGLALVQDPFESEYPDMALNAIQHVNEVDFVGTVDELARCICAIVGPATASLT